jgi:hypothetical protein
MTIDTPKVEFALLCDDVRREIGGKDIIIGLYSGQIASVVFPILMMVNVYMRVSFSKANIKFPMEFRIINSLGHQLIPTTKSILEAPTTEFKATVLLGAIPLQIQGPGLISFQLRAEDKNQDWETVTTLNVVHGTGTAPPAAIIGKMTTS